MSGSLPFPSARYARNSRLVAYLAVAYLLLVVYASLYPFTDWRVPNDEATRFLFAGWPSYIVVSDVVLNILAYMPLGLLLTLSWMGRVPRWVAVVLSVTAGMLLSLSIEFAQAYLPTRISSNVDVLTNSIGMLAGAAIACVCGERWLLSGELRRLRETHFRAGARTDLAFVLLALWLLTQLNAEIWLFGNGDLRHLIPANFGVHYSADAYLLLEAGVAALNFAGVAFLTGAIARSFAAAAASVAALILTALMLKTIASMALFIPGNPGLWLTPGSALGLVAGVMLWLPLARCPPVRSMRAAAICFAAGLFLVNLAPENPYLVAALQILQRGHFLRFNAMTGLLSSWWPFLAFAFLVFLMRGDNEDRPDSGRSGK
ncbi:MAG: VanZ family protein [Betaproteobacteria bacterium]|nr:VanZ family protein [Betaproteobacteria bacterium]